MSKYPRTDAARLKDVCRHMAMAEECTRMEYELNEAKARIKRMEEVGDKMEIYCDTILARDWKEAKEAKP